ncbi:MAG: hypothetical protein ABI837_08985 [Acidobacteriota bacterium]
MTTIRNRPEARWLPSRFHFALFRLYAAVRLYTAKPSDILPETMVVLAVDRDQSLEQYVVAVWLFLTTTAYVTSLLPIHPLVALPLAAIVSPFLLQLPTFLVGGVILPRFRPNHTANGIAVMGVLTAASLAYAYSHRWPRIVAFVFIGAMASNVVAAGVAWALRSRIAGLEREYLQS